MLRKHYFLGILLICGIICLIPWGQLSEGYCPSTGTMRRNSGGGQTNPNLPPPPSGVSRPPLTVGLQPRFISLRFPGGSFAGTVEPWEVWWSLNRERYLNFRQPVEWITIKKTESGTISRIEHTTYKDLFNILTQCIESNDMTLAWNTAVALGRSGDPNAIPILKKTYQDTKQILLKNYSVFGMGWIKDNSAIPILNNILSDKKEQEVVRSHAVATLGYFRDAEAVKLLRNIIADKESMKKQSDVAAAAAMALGISKDESAVEILSGLLNNTEQRIDPKIRSYAALGLGRAGTEDALKELKKACTDKDKDIRISVAIALGKLNTPKAKDDLMAMLKDKEPTVRGLAAISMAELYKRYITEIAVDDITKALSQLLKDSKGSTDDAGLVVIAMGLVGDTSVKEQFKEIMEDRKKKNLLKAAVVVAYGLLHDKDSIPALVDMLEKQPDDPIMSPYLIMALGMLGDEKTIAPIKALWDKVGKNVAAAAYTNMAVALTMLGKRTEVINQLKEHSAKTNKDSTLRQYAFHALGLLGDRAAGQTFIDSFKDEKSDSIKSYIVIGIGLMMEKTPMPMLADWTADNNTEVSTLIIDHLLPLPTW